MGKLQNKVLQLLAVIVVISAIACQAYQEQQQQQQHSSDSDYSETPSPHRHHKHHRQHRLHSVSLGHRNSSRYSLISGSATGNHYPQQQQPTHNYHHHHHQQQFQPVGNTVGQQPQWYHHRTPRTHASVPSGHRRDYDNGGGAQNFRPSRTPGQVGNTVGGGAVRPVKRMLKHNNHHNHHRNITG